VHDRLKRAQGQGRLARILLAGVVGVALVVHAGVGVRRAAAHEDASTSLVVVMDPVPARLARVRIQLQHTLADQLLVENRTGTPLEVLDDHGVPFLRIGPGGAEANLSAPTWYETVAADDRPIPPAARTGAAPVWRRVGTDPAWGWFDRRLRSGPAGEQAHAGRWTIPLRFGGVPVALHGRFQPVPPPSGAFVSRLTSPEEPFPGVRIRLMAGRVPALYLENVDAEPVVVLGADGEPFLRIGPEGTSANVRSPTWQRTGKAEVTTTAPAVDARATPDWQSQSAARGYAWIEFRAAPPLPAPSSTAAARPGAIVRRWRVPLRHGATQAVVAGEVEWVPAAHGVPRS
jgi:hypothetical protein